MKTIYKISMLVAFALLYGIMQAQILNYDFENLNVGDKVAETIGEPWTPWDLNPGGAKDAVITDEYIDGNHSMKIDLNTDIVLKLGDKTSGAYKISFDIYIPDNKYGYFNILHEFAGSNSSWAVQVYLNQPNSSGDGSHVYDGSNQYWFDFVPYNEWNHIETAIYLDDALACLKINGNMIYAWDYTRYALAKYNSIAAMNFCDVSGEDTHAGYYIDNIIFEEMTGPFTHNIIPHDNEINDYITPNCIDTVYYSFTNEGSGISAIKTWIDYGMGTDNGEVSIFHKDNEPYWNYGNFNNNPYIEIGVVFFVNDMINSSVMGTKITQIQYYLPWSTSDIPLGLEGPITYRIYNYDMFYTNESEALITEKVLYDYTVSSWNTVVLDEPIALSGENHIVVTVGFQQYQGGYPISLDEGPSKPAVADLVRLNGGSWFSLNQNSVYYGGPDYGNHNIRLVCEGEAVDASWIRQQGSIVNDWLGSGETKMYKLYFISNNHEYGDYHATLVVKTNNDVNPLLSIPIYMKVSGFGVDENAVNRYNIYPNPATDIIHIDGNDLNCAVIYNSNGQLINIVKINDKTISVKELGNGAYYLNIINNNGDSAIQKIVVSR